MEVQPTDSIFNNSTAEYQLFAGLHNKNLYWVLQIMGWASFSGLTAWYVFSSRVYQDVTPVVISLITTFFLGIIITHFFRYIYKINKWRRLNIVKQALLLFPAALLMSVLYTSIDIILDRVFDFNAYANMSLTVLLISVVNGSLLYLLWALLYLVAHYLKDARKREIETIKWDGAIKEYELNKLKSQLNPHFVFNALNTIRSLIDEDPHKAKESITQLSNILRNSLISDRSKTVTFSEELRTIKDYLNLEKLRYEDRLQVEIEIGPNTESVPVPPMMMQTLVENAVKHGILKQIYTGFIKVSAFVENQFLKVKISNSGTLGNLESGGFGLKNTQQRLQLLFGKKQYFAIYQEKEDTVTVELHIPLN